MFKKLIYGLKVWWTGIKKEVEKYPVHSSEIKALLRDRFKDCYIECEDDKYYTCEQETAEKIVSLIPLKFIKYRRESIDCDDYSRMFWTISKILFPRLTIGRCNVKMSEGGLHSLNFILYKNYTGRLCFNFIEPQLGVLKYYNHIPYMMQI